MTLLGKSFSVVILILSLTFMVLALAVNASHRNWKDVVFNGIGDEPGLIQQIKDIEDINDQLRDSEAKIKADLVREQTARRTALGALATELDATDQLLTDTQELLVKLQAENAQLAELDKTRADELKELTDDNVRLRSEIRKEQQDRDDLFAETLQLTDQMNALRGLKLQLEERYQQLMAESTRMKEVLTANGINVSDPLDGSPPDRNGNVLVINRPAHLVEVSIGYDDGLRKGHFLEVTRKGRYVGKLRVRTTEPNRAVAEILKDYSEGLILEGDRVDTTFE